MRPSLFFIFILILQLPLVDAGVQRTTQISDFYLNGTFVYKVIEVTLTPDNYDNYNIPGYGVTEYIPAELSLKSTNADWQSLSDNKVSMMRVLPPASNFSIRYTLKIPLNSPNTTYTFYGTYKDENKNTGEINSTDIKYSGSSSSSSTTPTPTPAKTYLPVNTLTPVPTPAPKTEEPLIIKPLNVSSNITIFDNNGNSLSILLLLIPILALVVGIKHYKKNKPKNIIFHMKILRNKTVFINYKIMTFPIKLEVKNTSNKTIFPKIKTKGNLPISIYPSLLEIPPQSESSFNITAPLIRDNIEYSGTINIKF